MPCRTKSQRGWAKTFGVLNLGSALLVFLGVFRGLPTRYFPVDAAAAALIALLATAGIGLVANLRRAGAIARVAAAVTLGLGLLLVTTLAVTASYLSGIYGPVGRGGALIMTLVAALSLPYLVVLPAVQLVWLGPWRAPVDQPDAAGARLP